MGKTEFHLITLGNSFVINFQKAMDDPKIKKAGMGYNKEGFLITAYPVDKVKEGRLIWTR